MTGRAIAGAALAALLSAFLFSSLPPVAAQAPDGHAPVYQFSLDVDESTTFKQVPYLGQAVFNYSISDFSRDSTTQPLGAAAPPDLPDFRPHQVEVEIEFLGNSSGWHAIGAGVYSTFGGDVVRGTMIVNAAPGSSPNYVTVLLKATMRIPDGPTLYDDVPVQVQLLPYWNGFVRVLRTVTSAGQDDIIQIPVEVTNRATYIDTYLLNATGPKDFQIVAAPRIVLGPESTAVVNVTVQTPKGKLYELQRMELITIQARSANEPKIAYTASAVVSVSGAYVSKGWIPLLALTALTGALLLNRSTDRREERVLQLGRPRRAQLTPRQEALLEELKRRDPEAHRQRTAQLTALYASRRATYKSLRSEQRALEREELKRARAEVKVEKRRREEERRLRKRVEKERAKEAHRLHKLYLERQKLLEKARAKADAARLKEEAKQAKLDEKERRRLAKLSAKTAKELEKRRKALAREAKRAARKRGGKEPPA